MYNDSEMSRFVKELRDDLWIKDPLVRRVILALFIDGIKNKTNSIILAKSNFETVILKEGSIIRKRLMNMLWLGREIMESLDRFIINRNFLEAKTLFSSLRDFFVANYDTVDLVVYKHDKDTNLLTYFAWNKELDVSNISISQNKYYKNELLSFHTQDPFTPFEETIQWWLYCKKISLPWGEDLVLSFHANTNIDIDEQKINMDIRRIIKLFQKNWLINDIKLTLALINVQYKDALTGAFNKKYATEIFKNKKYSTIFIDITDFKHLNDTFWHAFWDEVLKEVVHVLNKSVKSREDRVFRNWWDEFVILVSSFDEEVVKWVETRIHETLESTDFSNKLSTICERWWACLPELQKNCNKLKKYEPVKVKTWYHVFNHAERLSLDEMINKADMKMLSKQWEAWMLFRVFKLMSNLKLSETFYQIAEFAIDKISDFKVLDSIVDLINKRKSKLLSENITLMDTDITKKWEA